MVPTLRTRSAVPFIFIFSLAAVLTAVPTTPAHAGSTTVFFEDFNAGIPPEITGFDHFIFPVAGYAGLGNGGNVFGGDMLRNIAGGDPAAPTRLTLSGLPPHNSIDVNFLLAVIDDWQGTAGPDTFKVIIDSTPVFSESLHNTDLGQQTYAAPGSVLLAHNTPLGFDAGHNDAAYEIGLDPVFDSIPHTSSFLTIDFRGEGAGYSGGVGNETFALDNLEIIVNANCDATPVVGCLGGQGAQFQVKTKGGPLKYKIKWQLKKGDTFAQGDLGTPEATRAYTLCVYDETATTPSLVGELTIDPNANWVSNAPKGYKYKDKAGTFGGVQKAQFKTGDAGKTKVQIKTKGSNTPVPLPFSGTEMFDQDTKITVQLINNEDTTCWTSEFATNKKNELEQFKAKTP